MKSSLTIFAVTALAAGQLAQAAPVPPISATSSAVAARSLHPIPAIASTLQLRTPDHTSAEQLLRLRTDGGFALAELVARGALSEAEKGIDSANTISSLNDASFPALTGSSFSHQDATRTKLPAMDYKSAVRPKNDLAHTKKDLARPTVPALQSSEFPELSSLHSKASTRAPVTTSSTGKKKYRVNSQSSSSTADVHRDEANTASKAAVQVPNEADPIYIPILHSLRPKSDHKARPTLNLNMASVHSDVRPDGPFGISPGHRGLQEKQDLETMAAQERHVAWLLDSKDEAGLAHSPNALSPGVKHASAGSPPKLNAHAVKYKPASATSPPRITHNAEAPYIPGRGFGRFPRRNVIARFRVSHNAKYPTYPFRLAEWQYGQRMIGPEQFLEAIRNELNRRELNLRTHKSKELKLQAQLDHMSTTPAESKGPGKHPLEEGIQRSVKKQETLHMTIQDLREAIRESTGIKVNDPWSLPLHSPKDTWTPWSPPASLA